ncbi:MAG: NINE protein [Acutalibacteraceae bacterium]
MFCKNCGQQLNPNAEFCTSCGSKVGTGANFCPNCGAQTQPNAAVCVQCGVSLNNVAAPGANGNAQKSKMVAGILGILLGAFGVHNFYLGFTGKAVAQLLITLCTCGAGAVVSEIWGLIEGIQILTGSKNVDANGNPLSD